MVEERINNGNQDIMLYNRSKISISGITVIESFDEMQISAVTQSGELLTVLGSNIEITDFNTDKQILEAKGNFTAFYYDERKIKSKTGILSKIFGER